MAGPLVKSVFHNVGVVCVGFLLAWIGVGLDLLFGVSEFHFIATIALGSALLAAGFLLRIWASVYFYRRKMKVISLVPQSHLITSGPFRLSRNPLYLGGNVFIFFGAALVLGTPTGVILAAINIVLVDVMIRREEKQLARAFGPEWSFYKSQVRRWI
jgi:protein-S-isoprenylcysteine O-methyltransferase Ste14